MHLRDAHIVNGVGQSLYCKSPIITWPRKKLSLFFNASIQMRCVSDSVILCVWDTTEYNVHEFTLICFIFHFTISILVFGVTEEPPTFIVSDPSPCKNSYSTHLRPVSAHNLIYIYLPRSVMHVTSLPCIPGSSPQYMHTSYKGE